MENGKLFADILWVDAISFGWKRWRERRVGEILRFRSKSRHNGGLCGYYNVILYTLFKGWRADRLGKKLFSKHANGLSLG